MDPAVIQVILTNAGVGIAAAFVLVLAGVLVPGYAYKRALAEIDRRDEVIDKLRNTIETERKGQNELVRAGSVTNQLIDALTQVASTRAGPDEPRGAAGRRNRRPGT